MKITSTYTDSKGKTRRHIDTGLYSVVRFQCDRHPEHRDTGLAYTRPAHDPRFRGPCKRCGGYGTWTQYLSLMRTER